jgi:phosphatidylglycerol:prolipoprotein diacylglycerol transferase
VHPVLFTLPLPWGPQPIYAYGLMLGLALVAGFQIAARLGARERLDEGLLGTATVLATLGGLAGARALYVATNQQSLVETDQHWLDFTAGGLNAYGGLLGGFLAVALYLRSKRAPLLAFADAAAPAVAFGAALTRVGCYLHGCDFGVRLAPDAPSWLAKLGSFPRWQLDHLGLDGAPAYWHHVEWYDLPRAATAAFPVHPVQLYELVAYLALFAGALWLGHRRRFTGQSFLIVTAGYALLRFGFEYLRDDPERGALFGFSIAQLISLVLVPACAVAYSLLRKRKPA